MPYLRRLFPTRGGEIMEIAGLSFESEPDGQSSVNRVVRPNVLSIGTGRSVVMGFVIPTAESDVRIPYGPSFPAWFHRNGLRPWVRRVTSDAFVRAVHTPVLPRKSHPAYGGFVCLEPLKEAYQVARSRRAASSQRRLPGGQEIRRQAFGGNVSRVRLPPPPLTGRGEGKGGAPPSSSRRLFAGQPFYALLLAPLDPRDTCYTSGR